MIKANSFTSWDWDYVVIANKLHTKTLFVTTIAPVGCDLYVSQQLMASFSLTFVVVVTVGRWGLRTAGDLVTSSIIDASWLASIAIRALITIEAFCIFSMFNITDS